MGEPVNKDQDRSVDPSTWVDQYGDFLYRYALSRLRDAEASEEVVQDCFVTGLRAVDQYAGKGDQRAWLLGILKRKIVDYSRQRSREGVGKSDDGGGDLTETLFDETGHWRDDPRVFGDQPSASLERQEFWKIFRGCLETLPERQADAFTLREFDERSSEEICKDLSISASNLWVLLHRARLRLANCMKARWQAEGEPKS